MECSTAEEQRPVGEHVHEHLGSMKDGEFLDKQSIKVFSIWVMFHRIICAACCESGQFIWSIS